MSAIAQAAVSTFNLLIPPGINRLIAVSSLLLNSPEWVSLRLFGNSHSLRDDLTLFALKDRVTNETPFIQWIRQTYDLDTISTLEDDPNKIFIRAHLRDLICKVAVAAACYLTLEASLYTAVINLVSLSEKISKIALPVLTQMGSIPVPAFLPSAQVIALAPVFLKLIQLFIIHLRLNTDNTRPFLEALEKDIGAFNNGIEILWNLRFITLCLGISQTIYHSVVLTVFSIVANHFLHFPLLEALGGFLIKTDPWPTKGFSSGLYPTYRSMFGSHKSHNIEKLEQFFTKAQVLKNDHAKLKAYLEAVEAFRKEIAAAVKNGDISKTQATGLERILHGKYQPILQDNIPRLQLSLDQLEEQNATFATIIEFIRQDLIQGRMTTEQANPLKEALSQKMHEFYHTTVESHLNEDTFWQKEGLEAGLRLMFGKGGYLEQIEPSGEVFLLEHRFLFALFSLNLNWYLNHHQELLTKQRVVCEYLIYYQATIKDGIFEFKWNDMVKSQDFIGFLQSKQTHPKLRDSKRRETLITQFIQEKDSFDYLRQNSAIPTSFKFATTLLPFCIKELRQKAETDYQMPALPNPSRKELSHAGNRYLEFIGKAHKADLLYLDLVTIGTKDFS